MCVFVVTAALAINCLDDIFFLCRIVRFHLEFFSGCVVIFDGKNGLVDCAEYITVRGKIVCIYLYIN